MSAQIQQPTRRSVSVPPPPRVRILRTAGDLETISDEWNLLRDEHQEPSSSSSPEWALSWWNAFGPELKKQFGTVELAVLEVRAAEGLLMGVLPAYRIERSLIRLIPSQLVSFGSWPEGTTETMCEEPPGFFSAQNYQSIAKAVGDYLHSEFLAGTLDSARILWEHRSFSAEELQAWLQEGLRDSSRLNLRPNNPVILVDLAEDWVAHRKVMSRSMRDNLAYYPKLLSRAGHEWAVTQSSSREDASRAAGNVSQLHRHRSVHETLRLHKVHVEGPVQDGFLKELFTRLSTRQRGFIAELHVSGKVVAAQAFFMHRNMLTVYYSGFLPDWSKYSPLFVLDAHVFEKAMEQGVRTINFLTVPGQWQTRWGPTREIPTLTLLAINRKPFPALVSLAAIGRRLVKSRSQVAWQKVKAARHEWARRRLETKTKSSTSSSQE